MLFDLAKFDFLVRILPEEAEEGGGDFLWFRFRFQEPVADEKREVIKEAIDNWYNEIFEAKLANYMEDTYPKWYTKRTLCVFGVDTGGNEPELASHINSLIRKIGEISPLKEVEITAS